MDVTDPAFQDLIYRVRDLVHASETQTGGTSAGDNLSMVTLLKDIAWRLKTIYDMAETQEDGPSKGADSWLVKNLNFIKAQVAQIQPAAPVTLTDEQLANLAELLTARMQSTLASAVVDEFERRLAS